MSPSSTRSRSGCAAGVRPPPRGQELARLDAAAELRSRKIMAMDELDRRGLTPPVPPVAGQWVVDPDHLHTLQQSLRDLVRSHAVARPLDPGPTVEAAARVLDIPDREIVAGLLRPPLALQAGRVVDTSRATLPAYVVEAVGSLSTELAAAPFAAPDAERLAALRLGAAELAAAERAGALVRVADGVVLLPSAVDAAAGVLRRLPQPFTRGRGADSAEDHAAGRRSPARAARPAGDDPPRSGRPTHDRRARDLSLCTGSAWVRPGSRPLGSGVRREEGRPRCRSACGPRTARRRRRATAS